MIGCEVACNTCGSEPTRTALINGKFGNYCSNCIAGSSRTKNIGFAQWSRDRDRENNAADMQQPWLNNGKINREFVKNYPDRAKDLFTEREIRDNS